MQPDNEGHFNYGVWGVSPRAELVADAKADPTVNAMSEHKLRLLLSAAQDLLRADGVLAPEAYQVVERVAAIAISRGLLYHPDPVPPLSDADQTYWLLYYICGSCSYAWFDYWIGDVDAPCPRCRTKYLEALPTSHEIATSELPEWVNVRADAAKRRVTGVETILPRSGELDESDGFVSADSEEFRKVRQAAGRQINPATAEVMWDYGETFDPYGDDPDLPSYLQSVGRNYFARQPGGDWIFFGDLPALVREALWQRFGWRPD